MAVISHGALPQAAQFARQSANGDTADGLVAQVRADLLQHRPIIETPFGARPLVYADYTASGRSLGFLERNISAQVLPHYANTHTDASHTGAFSNAMRESARRAIRASVNGTEADKVIFCGAGATGTIDRIIALLGLRIPALLEDRYHFSQMIPAKERPVVFVGPYEHHSNELPWRESIADVVRIGLDAEGDINQVQLAEQLAQYEDRPLRIGSFSAASNVTGRCSDIGAITELLKAHGALAFWDYAAAGPYVAIDMNPPGAAPDAVFISPHKFIGGPGTPGVLVIKEDLMTHRVPAVVGGGTVSFVTPADHRYVADLERREEAGTPAIVESIRAGAVFALKDAIGVPQIEAIEKTYIDRALQRFDEHPTIEVLGPRGGTRLGIFSLRLRCLDKVLHYGFATRLLNDLFGIQARGGCSCAGPYGHDLLSLDESASRRADAAVAAGFSCLRPGWLRINCHWAALPVEIDYLIDAITLVADHGWRLLPSYQLNLKTGIWTHREHAACATPRVQSLLEPALPSSVSEAKVNAEVDYTGLLQRARALLTTGAPRGHREAAAADSGLPSPFDEDCWFVTACEAARALALEESDVIA